MTTKPETNICVKPETCHKVKQEDTFMILKKENMVHTKSKQTNITFSSECILV
jgi:hypothetical protein